MPAPRNKNKNPRRRPSTPSIKVSSSPRRRHRTADPASPPETPSSSPVTARKISLKPRHQPPLDELADFARTWGNDPSIRPIGNGHQFSYRPGVGPEQLSPRSASTSDEDEDEDVRLVTENRFYGGDDASDRTQSDSSYESEDDQPDHRPRGSHASRSESDDPFIIHTSVAAVEWDFTVEDIDPMDSEYEGLDILHPTEIESTPSRPRTRQQDRPQDLDTGMEQDMENLHCSNEVSDNDADSEEEDAAAAAADAEFRRRQQELKRMRRVSMSSSFGKRTHSEISDSDDDDAAGSGDVNEVGSSARRMRKRLHRTSLLFQDPPEPRIDELDEPDSSGDDFPVRTSLARELPYFAMEVMEPDSS